jgi:hypothetical protein
MSVKHKTEKSEKAVQASSNKQVKIAVVLALLLMVGVALLLNNNSNSDKKTSNSSGSSSSSSTLSNGNGKMYIKPANQDVKSGSTVTLEVWEDSGNQSVNAVQANLTYPTGSFDFSNIDPKGSAFEVQALSTGGNGKVQIARGHIGNLKGTNLVAKVTLTAKSVTGEAKVDFASGSAIVTSTDHKDILTEKTGSTYKVD